MNVRISLLALALSACGSTTPSGDPSAAQEPPPERRAPPEPQEEETIGSATMEADGTITLQLRATDGAGALGDALVRYPPSHPQYQSILDHVGRDMRPGDTRPVRPFPD